MPLSAEFQGRRPARGGTIPAGVASSRLKDKNPKFPLFPTPCPRLFWGTAWKQFRADALKLIASGDRVLAMVSGGPDSMAMAHWLALLLKKHQFQWAIAHFNHGLRPGAVLVFHQVRELAQRLNVSFYYRRLNVKGLLQKRRLSLEDAARRLRYREAHDLARRHGFNKIAAAHTLEEQAESVLLNILRGGSLQGLLGARPMRPVAARSRIMLIRPMLGTSKKILMEFLNSQKIVYDRDPMNDDPRFLRSRIRHELLPKLQELHPRALEHLSGLAFKLGVK
ncbi:MAG: tRNA lysidine(34) synthetase TilS [Elusimicrobia bacterium]|nr:tRNA lysidine(34) synthetase TilS [Elusimicrobiota bacterium]